MERKEEIDAVDAAAVVKQCNRNRTADSRTTHRLRYARGRTTTGWVVYAT